MFKHLSIFALLCCVLSSGARAELTIKLAVEKTLPVVVTVEGCAESDLEALAKLPARELGEHLQVFVKSALEQANAPAVLGQVNVQGKSVRFEPRFAIEPGVEYVARFRMRADQPWQTQCFTLPKKSLQPSTYVTEVYPKAAKLPQNLLKFYVYFSAPMTQREAYQHVELLDAQGKRVPFPFLEIAEELWDKSGQRLTLLLDPGRVKRGLVPREEDGPILTAGSSYRLVIKSTWPDARGVPLTKSHTKSFAVGPEDFRQPDPATWKINTPKSKTRDPLTIVMPEPMDHATYSRGVTIEDDKGQVVLGDFTFSAEETKAHFTPIREWRAGLYDLRIWTRIEDLVGNSIDRPFELDRFESVATAPNERATLTIEVQ